MQLDVMLNEIGRRGGPVGRLEAFDAAGAVLSVLAERLTGGAPDNLAAQLPPELGDSLEAEGEGERFGLDEFTRRVAARERRSIEQARRDTAAVLGTVFDAVSEGERDHIASQLPDDYVEVFGHEIPSRWREGR